MNCAHARCRRVRFHFCAANPRDRLARLLRRVGWRYGKEGEKVAWLQEKAERKEELEVLTGSPTSSNLL